LTKKNWSSIIQETLSINNYQDASVRFIATRGVSTEVVADPRYNTPTEIVWAAPYVFLANEKDRKRGIKLMISHLRGFSPDTLDPRYKCVNRLHYQLAKIEALEAGYDDVIWLDQNGNIAEGPASNIFAVKNQIIYTPCEGILRGITRQTFIDLAERSDIEVRPCNISSFDLFTADEVFTTSTAGGALAIREISGRPLPSPVPGPITILLDSLYWEMRENGEHATIINYN
jgi:branched-chain amino acid aminotransferase